MSATESPDSGGGTASDEPRTVSLPNLLATKARQTGAVISFIEDAQLVYTAYTTMPQPANGTSSCRTRNGRIYGIA